MVHLLSVVLSADNFRGHPVECSDAGGGSHLAAADAGAEPEVGDLDIAGGVQQDVVRLDVAVNHAALVQVVQAFEDLKIFFLKVFKVGSAI